MNAGLDIKAERPKAEHQGVPRPAREASLRGYAPAVLRLAAPMSVFFLIQSGVNLASLAILGRLGDAALAGVGAAATLFAILVALLFGVDAATQAVVSRLTGAGRSAELAGVLADAWVLSLGLGLGLGLTAWFAGPALVAALLSGPAAAIGGAWIEAAAPALLCLAVTIPVNACWVATGRPGRALGVNALLAPLQIAATFALVLGAGPVPAQGAVGAGEALSLSTLAGVGVQLFLVTRLDGVAGLSRAAPRAGGVRTLAVLGWPISLQQALLQLGLMAAFVIVARLGTASVAAVNVLINLATVPAQTAAGFGVAAATLVGQALGRAGPDEARAWGWRTALIGAAATAPMGLDGHFAPHAVLGLFLRDPATLALAEWPTRLVGAGVLADTLGRILSFALRGAGATRTGAAIPFLGQWLAQLPLAWWAALVAGWGLAGMAAALRGVAIVEAAVLVLIWRGSGWTAPRAFARG